MKIVIVALVKIPVISPATTTPTLSTIKILKTLRKNFISNSSQLSATDRESLHLVKPNNRLVVIICH